MAEPTVQVPVSLIERAKQFDHRGGLGSEVHAWLSELLTLLSQPTPSAEPKPLNPDAVQRVLDYHGWPPRIADMAPGTTFGYPIRWQVGEYKTVSGRKVAHATGLTAGVVWLDDLDPSTIRDVVPPKEPTA